MEPNFIVISLLKFLPLLVASLMMLTSCETLPVAAIATSAVGLFHGGGGGVTINAFTSQTTTNYCCCKNCKK
jgi:hypothetical protein